jgi:hypothetical protein
VERIAVHRITRGHGITRQIILPGRIFSLTEQEAAVLDAQGSTADPRQTRQRGDGDTSVIERVAEPIEPEVRATELPAEPGSPAAVAAAAVAAAKPAGKNGNGTTTRAQPAEDDGEL